MTLEAILKAAEEQKIGEEKSLVEGTGPLPLVPVVPGAVPPPSPKVQPAQPQIFGVDIPNIPSPLALAGDFLTESGLPNNPFSIAEGAVEASADWLAEQFTHRQEEKTQEKQGLDVRQRSLSAPLAKAVRAKQSSLGGWLSMHARDPEFTKRAAQGALAALWNEDARKRNLVLPTGDVKNYAPSQFDVRLNTDTNELTFKNPDTGDRLPFDSYAITPEDFSHILTELKPLLWELGGAVAGSATGTGIGAISKRPTIAQRTGVVGGVAGEALGAIQGTYDKRVDVLKEQGYRPVKWLMPSDDPSDKTIPIKGRKDSKGPLRWVFWNAGTGEEKGGFYDSTARPTYTDASVFATGAPTQALFSVLGAGAATVLYRLYRWNKGDAAANLIGDVATSKDFARAMDAQGKAVSRGELLAADLNTPQLFTRYANELDRQAGEASAAGNRAAYNSLKSEALYYRKIGSAYQSQLIGVGGATAATEATQDIARTALEKEGLGIAQVVTGPPTKPGVRTAEDISDAQILDTGETLVQTLSQDAAQQADAGLSAVDGSIQELQRTLLELGGKLGRGQDPSTAGNIGPSSSPFRDLSDRLEQMKSYLFQGTKPDGSAGDSYFDEIYGHADDALRLAVTAGGAPRIITIRAPAQFRAARRRIASAGRSLDLIDPFIKDVSRELKLPIPTYKDEKVFGLGPKTEVTGSVSLISRRLKELRAMKSELKTGEQKGAAEQFDRALVNLRERLAKQSEPYRRGTADQKTEIIARLNGLNKVDESYHAAQQIYSRSSIGKALLAAGNKTDSVERSATFFKTLIPPNATPDEIQKLLVSLNHPTFGIRMSEDITAENLLTNGLYQTYLDAVYGGASLDDILRDRANITTLYDPKKHAEFIQEYGNVFKRLLPDKIGNRSGDEVFQELVNDPPKMFALVRDRLDTYKKFQTAVENNTALKNVGIKEPFDPATAVSEVLTYSPSSYPILRQTVNKLSVNPAQKKQLIADLDEAVKSFFVRRITTESPSGGVRINGEAIQKTLQKFRDVKADEGKLGDAMATIFTPEQIRRMQGIGKDLEILEHSAQTSGTMMWPKLTGSVLDTKTPLGALARVYVGVLNVRARALTGIQRVLGGKAEKVLLDALLDPKKAKDLASKRVAKPGMMKKLLINFVGSTTGVYFNEEEAEDVLNIAGITGEEIEAERMFMPKRPKPGPYPDVRAIQDLEADVQVPGLNIPSFEAVSQLPLSSFVPDSARLEYPGTVPPSPELTDVVRQGVERLPEVGIAALRQAEQRKMIGLPFNKGGIVNARPRRQIVL